MKWGPTALIERQWFYQTLLRIDSLVFQNRHLRVAAKRYVQLL